MAHRKQVDYFIIVTMLSILAACSTVPSDAPRFSEAPKPKNKSSILYVYRYQAEPLLRTPTLWINQQKVITQPEKTFTWIYVTPGTHTINVQWPWDTLMPMMQITVTIKEDEEKFIRYSSFYSSNGYYDTTHLLANDIDKKTAEEQLQDCCRYIAPLKTHYSPMGNKTQ